MKKTQPRKKPAPAGSGAQADGPEPRVARLESELAALRAELDETKRKASGLKAALGSANRDLENLLKPMGQPLLIVDHELKIKLFNSAASKLFYLSSSDRQKEISLVDTRIPLPDLGRFLRHAMKSQQIIEEEIRAGGEIYAMRIFPYLDDDGVSMGALLRFVEKTDWIQAERERSSIGYIAHLFMLYDDLDDFYRELPKVLSQRLNFPYALLELFDGEYEESVMVGCCGLDQAEGPPPRHPLPGSVAGWVIQSGRTYIHESTERQAKVDCPPLGGKPVETLVAVPLRIKDTVLGVITLADHKRRPVTEHLVETLEVVGINAGLGIERRRAQQTVMQATTEALRESLERYRKIVETANEGIWIVNQQLRTEFANPQMAQMLGYRPEEIRNRSAFHFIPLEDRKEALHKWRRTHEGLQESSDWRLLRKDGSQLWALISTSPLYDEEDRFSGALGMVADITHRKMSEQELLDHRQKLRALASELSMVEERERRRIASDMHDGVGHLLAAIKLRLDMLLETGPKQCDMIEGILEVLDQAIATTRSLISDLSPPVLHEMGLAVALEWLAERVSQMSGITVTAQVEPPMEPINEEMGIILFRAASELLTNVVKHSGAKSARVALRNDGNRLVLEVEDDGRGFDPGQLKMDSFGLFSIRERLSFLGGSLDIQSRAGKGARATLSVELGPHHD